MCEGNAIERSSKIFHESSEIRNKRQVRFRAIFCPNPKWRLCFYFRADFCPRWRPCFLDKQLSVPIDGSANFKFLALSRPKWHLCNHNFKFQADYCPNDCNTYRPSDLWQLPVLLLRYYHRYFDCKIDLRLSNYDSANELKCFESSDTRNKSLSASRRRQIRNYDSKSLAPFKSGQPGNYDGDPRTKSLAVFRSKRSSNYDIRSFAASRFWTLSNYDNKECQFLTSVDCRVLIHRNQTSYSSHHLQRLFQVYWYVGFWGSTIYSNLLPARRFK